MFSHYFSERLYRFLNSGSPVNQKAEKKNGSFYKAVAIGLTAEMLSFAAVRYL